MERTLHNTRKDTLRITAYPAMQCIGGWPPGIFDAEDWFFFITENSGRDVNIIHFNWFVRHG